MYDVVQSSKFSAQIGKLYPSHTRTDDLIKAIIWFLRKTPRIYLKVEGDYYLWVTDTLPVKTIPKVRILYQVDDAAKTVTLLSIEPQVDGHN